MLGALVNLRPSSRGPSRRVYRLIIGYPPYYLPVLPIFPPACPLYPILFPRVALLLGSWVHLRPSNRCTRAQRDFASFLADKLCSGAGSVGSWVLQRHVAPILLARHATCPGSGVSCLAIGNPSTPIGPSLLPPMSPARAYPSPGILLRSISETRRSSSGGCRIPSTAAQLSHRLDAAYPPMFSSESATSSSADIKSPVGSEP